jgi:uncharacterized membrane protein
LPVSMPDFPRFKSITAERIDNLPIWNIGGIMSPPYLGRNLYQGCKKLFAGTNHALLIFPSGVKSAPATPDKRIMTSQIRTARNEKRDAVLRWSSIILAALGAADALYLLIFKLSNNNKMCLGNGGCATVNSSSYSELFGIPVSLFGLLAYLAIIAIILLEPRWKLAAAQGPLAIMGIALGGVLFSAYLTYIEFFVIFAVCPFCIISAVVITLLFILAIIRLVTQPLT